jgi:hypothetical protein
MCAVVVAVPAALRSSNKDSTAGATGAAAVCRRCWTCWTDRATRLRTTGCGCWMFGAQQVSKTRRTNPGLPHYHLLVIGAAMGKGTTGRAQMQLHFRVLDC